MAGTPQRRASFSPSSPSMSINSKSATRPTFTTSLSDFALRQPRPSSPVPSSRGAAHLNLLTAPTYTYSLRPRSSLSRSVVVAGEDQHASEDLSSSSSLGGARNDRSGSPNHSHLRSRSEYRHRSPTAWSSSSRQGNDGDAHRDSRRSEHGRSGRRLSRNREHSPSQRALTSPQSPQESHVSDEDVELDLDGMDMKMTDADENQEAGPPSSSDAGGPAMAVSTPRRATRASIRRASVAPPLLRVFHQLQDEAKPSESEVASEAKLTKRLAKDPEAVAMARMGPEGGLWTTTSDPELDPAMLADGIPDLPLSNAGSVDASMGGNPAGAQTGLHDEEDLLDNVAFESDHHDDGSEDSDDEAVPHAMTSSGTDWEASESGLPAASSVDQKSTLRVAQSDVVNAAAESLTEERHSTETADEAMSEYTEALSADTPDSRADPHNSRSEHSNSPAPLVATTVAGAMNAPSSSTSSSSTPLSARPGFVRASTPASSSSTRKRSSAWLDFRNSPSATVANANSLEKRHHHHRLQHAPYHRPNRSQGAAMDVSRLSTSPAAASPLNSGVFPGATGSPSELSAASARALGVVKRKLGSDDRYEPLASSVYKRRAVSPSLANMHISLAGLNSGPSSDRPLQVTTGGILVGGSRPSSDLAQSSPASQVAGRRPSLTSTIGSPPGGPSAGYFNHPATSGSGSGSGVGKRAIITPRGRKGSFSGSPAARPATPTSSFTGPQSIPPFGQDGSGLGPPYLAASSSNNPFAVHSSSPQSPIRAYANAPLPSPLARAIAFNPYLLSQHHSSSTPSFGAGMVGLGLGDSATTTMSSSPTHSHLMNNPTGMSGSILGSSPRSLGSGPGYGSGGLGLSIAANCRDSDDDDDDNNNKNDQRRDNGNDDGGKFPSPSVTDGFHSSASVSAAAASSAANGRSSQSRSRRTSPIAMRKTIAQQQQQQGKNPYRGP